ncbi:MAG: hypothetical protein NC311_16440, partial [Muribaculaceae bacterium]|nr:hypothetical protein [Muribaculaceae bacterium]
LSGKNVTSVTGGKTTVALSIQPGDSEFAGTGTIYATGLGESGQLGVNSTNNSLVYMSTHMGDAADDLITGKKADDTERAQAITQVVDVDTSMGLYLADQSGNPRTEAGLSAAIRKDGSVYAWGANDFGQMSNRIIGVDPLTGTSLQTQPNYVDDMRLVLQNQADGVRSNRLVHVLNVGESDEEVADWRIKPLITWFNVYQDMPRELNEQAEYMFASTNDSVVGVDENGVLTYKTVGTANIMIYEKHTRLKTLLEVEVLPNNPSYYNVNIATGEKTLKDTLVAPALASGVDFSVALDAMGNVYAWGSNAYGQVAQGNLTEKYYDSFQKVLTGYGAMDNMVSVAAGDYFALAAGQDGLVYAWGRNFNGSLGQNTDVSTIASYPVPQPVRGPDGTGYLGDERTGKIVKVFANGSSAAAITERGELYVWGDSGNNRLAARSNDTYYLYPHKVPGLNHVQEVYISGNNMVILTEGTELWVSGDKSTRIAGWGDLAADGTPIDYEDGNSVYPLPMLNGRDGEERDYQSSAASVGLGDDQAIFLTLEYEQYAEGDELLAKRMYLLGKDEHAVLGTLDVEGITGTSGTYVNEPTEYDFFDDTELARLITLVDDAYDYMTKYGNRYDATWQSYQSMYNAAVAALTGAGITTPSDMMIREKIMEIYGVDNDTAETVVYFVGANPDWIQVALNAAVQDIITLEGAYYEAVDLAAADGPFQLAVQEHQKAVGLWSELVNAMDNALVSAGLTARDEDGALTVKYEDIQTALIDATAAADTASELYKLAEAEKQAAIAEKQAADLAVDNAKTEAEQNQAIARQAAAAKRLETATTALEQRAIERQAADDAVARAQAKKDQFDVVATNAVRGLLSNAKYADIMANVDLNASNGDLDSSIVYATIYANLTERAKPDLEDAEKALVDAQNRILALADQLSEAKAHLLGTTDEAWIKGHGWTAAQAEGLCAQLNMTATEQHDDNGRISGYTFTVKDGSQSKLEAAFHEAVAAYQDFKAIVGSSEAPNELDMVRMGDTLRAYASTLVRKTSYLTGWVSEDNTYKDTSISANIAAVYAGKTYTGAITDKGYTYLWGDNGSSAFNGGILGNRKNTDTQTTPSLVYRKEIGGEYLSTVVRMASMSGTEDSRHVLAHIGAHSAEVNGQLIEFNGITYAWGSNQSGQLGNHGTNSVTVPTVVGGGSMSAPSLVRLTLGASNTPLDLDVDSNDYLMVYGGESVGQDIYAWKSLDDSIVKVRPVAGATMHAQLEAVREGETKVLAENVITGQIVFTRVIVTDGVTYPQLVLGRDTTTALKKNGTVWAWGDNSFREIDYNSNSAGFGEYTTNADGSLKEPYGTGKLGIDTAQTLVTTPVQVANYRDPESETPNELIPFENITKISSGDNHTLAVDNTGHVYAWGDNTFGQLGYNPTTMAQASSPVLLHITDEDGNEPTFVSVAAGSNHSLALTDTGMVYAWGDNHDGQLGRGTTATYTYETDRATIRQTVGGNGDYLPTAMNGFNDLKLTGVLDMAATVGATAVLLV